MTQVVDWELAAAAAAALGRSGPRVTFDEAADAVHQLRQLTDVAAGHVAAYTGLSAQVEHPPVRVVDRRDWAAANVAGLRQVMGPLLSRLVAEKRPSPVAEAIGARLSGAQAGAVLAYLSGRVLGQYEVFAGDPGQLLLVAPNIVDVERRLGVNPHDFRLWVCLHEVTHRTQFTAVPWLRGHFLDQVGQFVDAAGTDRDEMAARLRQALAGMADTVRGRRTRVSVVDLVSTPAQKVVLDRLTALMTVLEGHAEHVMDEVGPEVIPSVAAIRERFDQRRRSGNPLEKALRRLLGVDVKLRQYAEGRKFVHAVVEEVGMTGFNRVFTEPAALPDLAELADPSRWVARVGRSGPTA
ncbi:zinc-dependent metalloprotease [Pilimelia columellifera]|uniref:Zinc-dependent metalloprotease n=1 Tax=Pilimelia columellifera subsp. columellifera TaxID=706583 RepID=A0ABN3NC85_9ACTN